MNNIKCSETKTNSITMKRDSTIIVMMMIMIIMMMVNSDRLKCKLLQRKSYEYSKRCHLSNIVPNKLLLFVVLPHSIHFTDESFLAWDFLFDYCQLDAISLVRKIQLDRNSTHNFWICWNTQHLLCSLEREETVNNIHLMSDHGWVE